MAYDARAIANWFLDRASAASNPITQMKLQKLVFVSHGWNLALAEKPLIFDQVEAWKWGPVIRSLYREFEKFGSGAITEKARVFDGTAMAERVIDIRDIKDVNPEQTDSLLSRIWDVYGCLTAAQLSKMTHQAGTPWDTVWNKLGGSSRPYAVIPADLIKTYFKSLALGSS